MELLKQLAIETVQDVIECGGEGLLDDVGVDPEVARSMAEEIVDEVTYMIPQKLDVTIYVKNNRVDTVIGLKGYTVIDLDMLSDGECPRCGFYLDADGYCDACEINWDEFEIPDETTHGP